MRLKGENMSQERARELVDLFDSGWDEYLREEVEEALTLREEITPLLLDILEKISADPAKYAAEDHFSQNYGVALLAHFREPKAHLPLIKAFNLPQEQLDLIWGDMVTESFPGLACRTAHGDYAAIQELVLDRNAYEFLRGAAMECIVLAVARGEMSRDEALVFYASLMADETLAEPDDYFWSGIVTDLLDLYPGDLINGINDLYAKGYISEGEISVPEIDKVMADGLERTLAQLPERLAWRVPEDVHKYISWFACFRPDEQRVVPASQSILASLKKKKAKSKVKRKQAKAAKRRNKK